MATVNEVSFPTRAVFDWLSSTDELPVASNRYSFPDEKSRIFVNNKWLEDGDCCWEIAENAIVRLDVCSEEFSIEGEHIYELTLRVDANNIVIIKPSKGDLEEEKESKEMLNVYSVSVWDVEGKEWVCWQEPFVGNQENVRAWVAEKFNIPVCDLDNYDWKIVSNGSVRKSLDE